MNKIIKILGITLVLVLVAAALIAGLAFAQIPARVGNFVWGSMMNGYGMMGRGASDQNFEMSTMMGNGNGNGHMGGMMNGSGMMGGIDMDDMHAWMSAGGGMHAQVWQSLAKTLGLTPDELTTQLNNGKTLTQLAQEKGITEEQLASALETAVKASLNQLVAGGKLTQDQADQMLEHMAGNYLWMVEHWSSMNGAGGCHDNPSENTNDSQGI